MNIPFNIVPADAVKQAIQNNYLHIYNVIKQAYLAYGANESVNPPSSFLWFPEKSNSRVIALPAFINNVDKSVGIKWISSQPDNLQRGLPRASAVVIMNDYSTGFPKACLEGSLISATRTAMSAVLVADQLKPNKSCENLAIIGNGFIAEILLKSLLNGGWQIGKLCLYDQNPQQALAFKQKFPQLPCTIEQSAERALEKSDLIIFLTTALTPHIHRLESLSHNPLILHISLRDLVPEIIVSACNIVDDKQHILQANTSVHLASQKFNTDTFIHGDVYALLTQQLSLNPHQLTIFSPMGLGVLDIALGEYILNYCLENQLTTTIPNFFNFNPEFVYND